MKSRLSFSLDIVLILLLPNRAYNVDKQRVVLHPGTVRPRRGPDWSRGCFPHNLASRYCQLAH